MNETLKQRSEEKENEIEVVVDLSDCGACALSFAFPEC